MAGKATFYTVLMAGSLGLLCFGGLPEAVAQPRTVRSTPRTAPCITISSCVAGLARLLLIVKAS
jgi:hypothetical protein